MKLLGFKLAFNYRSLENGSRSLQDHMHHSQAHYAKNAKNGGASWD